MGSTGQGFLNEWNSYLPDHILVAPTGYQNSWNVAHESSKAPDVTMLENLIDILKSYENVDGTKVRIIGFSNGAALANRAYVQLSDSAVDHIVTIATSFMSPMYRHGNFQIPVN